MTQGSKSRPKKSSQVPGVSEGAKDELACEIPGLTTDLLTPEIPVKPKPKQVEQVYPSKRHQKRLDFLQNWKDFFSKQWDVCCQWNFKNNQKMYGSIQFESILKADQSIRQKFAEERSKEMTEA